MLSLTQTPSLTPAPSIPLPPPRTLSCQLGSSDLCARTTRCECSCAFWAVNILGNLGVMPGRRPAALSAEDGSGGVTWEGADPTDPRLEDALNDSETVVLLVLVLIGVLVWATILASVVDIVTNIDPDTRIYRNTLDSLNRYLNLHDLPADNPMLCRSLREYFGKSMHLHRARAHQGLLSLMSPTLQVSK